MSTPVVPDPMVRPTLTVAEAGALLGVKPATAYDYVQSGSIPVVRLSARKYVVPTAKFLREVLGIETSNHDGESVAPAPADLSGGAR